jgi:hypothetical protein
VWSPELAPAGSVIFTDFGSAWVVIAAGGGAACRHADVIPGIAAQLATLATGAWIDAGQPVVALGDSGTGKPTCSSVPYRRAAKQADQ